jgi:CRISPR-associated protein Cas1
VKRLLNTLYVTLQGAYLSREGETAVVGVDGEVRLRVPVHTLAGIVCFGNVSCSSPLMDLCGEKNVGVSFFSERGRFMARVEGPTHGNVLLRREQYRRADDAASCAALARGFVAGKIANSRTVLLRALRDHGEQMRSAALQGAADRMARVAQRLPAAGTLDELRGCEGDASRLYFEAFDHLIVAQKEDFFFRERSRRPPLDNVNALLSFLYTLLAHDVESALEGVGIDPQVGFLHRDRPGRPGLALDVMEELRPILADRLALSLVNLQQIRGGGFRKTETGAVVMDDATRKEVIVAYQKRKQEEIHHPFLDEKIEIGLIPHAQALLLSRHLRGDLDGYPPFLWK